MEFDAEHPQAFAVEAQIDAASIWTGDTARDEHLRQGDFLDVEKHPKIAFSGNRVRLDSANDFKLTGDLTIRGITRPVTLDIRYLGQWDTFCGDTPLVLLQLDLAARKAILEHVDHRLAACLQARIIRHRARLPIAPGARCQGRPPTGTVSTHSSRTGAVVAGGLQTGRAQRVELSGEIEIGSGDRTLQSRHSISG